MITKLLLFSISTLLLVFVSISQLASFLPEARPVILHGPSVEPLTSVSNLTTRAYVSTTSTNGAHTNHTPSGKLNTLPANNISESSSSTTLSDPSVTGKQSTLKPTTPEDFNADPEDNQTQPTPSNGSFLLTPPSIKPDDGMPSQNGSGTNKQPKPQPNRPPDFPNGLPTNDPDESDSGRGPEFDAFIYSVFIVYVSIVKLIYHNFGPIKRYLTEPGVLMIFGIVWELVARQVHHDTLFPRFNVRIFFYLFLPSTVLESASQLSNKWLFINMLQILTLSIVGTLIYASSLGYTIFFLSNSGIFNPSTSFLQSSLPSSSSSSYIKAVPLNQPPIIELTNNTISAFDPSDFRAGSESALFATNRMSTDSSYNLTLDNCLMFGVMLSSIDSTTMLNVFRQLQVNDKLYYLALGESLMNNAVVIVVFNLLLKLFNTTLTASYIYVMVIQFFITLVGSIFIGILLAFVALIAIRLTKRLQSTSSPSYQSQYHAIIETLMILKFAYLSYTLASQVNTSSVLSLATFGILQDQYIKYNLNLRCQLTLRQVVLAIKMFGRSLIYPLLGMLLVEVTDSTQFLEAQEIKTNLPSVSQTSAMLGVQGSNDDNTLSSTVGTLASRWQNLTMSSSFSWNSKFLVTVTIFVFVYRFAVVVLLSTLCNLCSRRQLKIQFNDQLILAYGGLKGPLPFALVSRMIEHEDEHRFRGGSNKHLFMSTVLCITFISILLKGSLIRPLAAKLQPSQKPMAISCPVISELNEKLSEYMTHGLNSIIGRTKSPYDKFTEFNETHIKPWITREGFNTNWISVFYDNLILDETLNANCFFRSALQMELQPDQGSTINRSSRQISSNAPSHIVTTGRRSSSLSTKDAASSIDTRRRSRVVPSRIPAPLASLDEPSTIKRVSVAKPSLVALQTESRSSALKQLVMHNLREENARSRRNQTATIASSKDVLLHQDQKPQENALVYDGSRKPKRMLSTTSSTESDLPTGVARNSYKQKHLKVVERRLNEIDPPSWSRNDRDLSQLSETNLSPSRSRQLRKSRKRQSGLLAKDGHHVRISDPLSKRS